jgi:trans-aconitate methyltransferase
MTSVRKLTSSCVFSAKARARADYPGERWITGDIAAWAREGTAPGYDLVFTNAALHWLPDHASLFPALLRTMAPGGVLACQMPRNFAAPSHRLLRETMQNARWRERLAGFADWEPVAEPSAYYDWLGPHASTLDIWETEYLQVLQGEDAVLRVKGRAGARAQRCHGAAFTYALRNCARPARRAMAHVAASSGVVHGCAGA